MRRVCGANVLIGVLFLRDSSSLPSSVVGVIGGGRSGSPRLYSGLVWGMLSIAYYRSHTKKPPELEAGLNFPVNLLD